MSDIPSATDLRGPTVKEEVRQHLPTHEVFALLPQSLKVCTPTTLGKTFLLLPYRVNTSPLSTQLLSTSLWNASSPYLTPVQTQLQLQPSRFNQTALNSLEQPSSPSLSDRKWVKCSKLPQKSLPWRPQCDSGQLEVAAVTALASGSWASARGLACTSAQSDTLPRPGAGTGTLPAAAAGAADLSADSVGWKQTQLFADIQVIHPLLSSGVSSRLSLCN